MKPHWFSYSRRGGFRRKAAGRKVHGSRFKVQGSKFRIQSFFAAFCCALSLLPISAQETKTARRQDYSSFKIITDRNIFNSGRGARSPARTKNREEKAPVKMESFTLVGTMTYEKGPFAFFDSANSSYRKALPPDGDIAGYKVSEIGGHTVKLTSGTNAVELRVGMQMRREGEGEWEPAGDRSDFYAGSSGAASSASAASADSSGASDENSEILKRLMQQREQELK